MASTHPRVAVLLVGGKSSRMGVDKFAMNINGRPQWAFMVEELNTFFENVYISCRRDQAVHFSGQHLIFDELEGIGPMGAIHAAFLQLEHASTIFFVACDMPNFSIHLAAKLHAALSDNYDVIAAYNPARQSVEPLVAFWNRSAMPRIEQFIAQENYALFDCMSQLKVKTVAVGDDKLLRNVNSPNDL